MGKQFTPNTVRSKCIFNTLQTLFYVYGVCVWGRGSGKGENPCGETLVRPWLCISAPPPLIMKEKYITWTSNQSSENLPKDVEVVGPGQVRERDLFHPSPFL